MSIDALVAERVLGWKKDEYGCWAEGTHPSHGGRVRWCEPDSEGLDSLNDAEVWSPSTDPAAMMVVVEKLDERKLGIHITRMRSLKDGALSWTVEIHDRHNCNSLGFADAKTMPMAFCLAALRAERVPEPEIQAAQEGV